MKTITKTSLMLGLMIMSIAAFGQKKTQEFTVSRVIQAPADQVWAVVGEDFGAIANSHPGIVSSAYLEGSLKGEEGAERVCHFNEAGTKYTHEKQVEFDPKGYRFKAQIFHAEGLPMDPESSYMLYDVEPIDGNSSKLILTMTFRTKPAFMGAIAKGKFQKTIEGYALSVAHHVLTGESVNKDNFKAISQQYKGS